LANLAVGACRVATAMCAYFGHDNLSSNKTMHEQFGCRYITYDNCSCSTTRIAQHFNMFV